MSLLTDARGSAKRESVAASSQHSPLAASRTCVARRGRQRLRTALLVTDAITLILALLAASALRIVLENIVNQPKWTPGHYMIAAVALVVVDLALFRASGLYDFDHILAGTREYALITHAVSYGIIAAIAISYFAASTLVSRSWLLMVWVLSIALVGSGRFAARRVVRRLRGRGALRTRVVVVGASTTGVAIAEQLRVNAAEGIDVVGFLDEYVPLGQQLVDQIDVIGRPGDLLSGRLSRAADEYVLVPTALPHERLEELTRLMVSTGGPTIRLAVSTSDLLTNGVLVAERGSVPMVTLRRARLAGSEAVAKRGLDVLGSVIVLGIFWLPTAVVVLRARIRGGRQMLIRKRVYAADGRPVSIYVLSKQVTSWLPMRAVPALLPVLYGEVSLVGPRPVVVAEGQTCTFAVRLSSLKPGLTGPWRLSDPQDGSTDRAERDVAYVRNYSIWEDLRILLESTRRFYSRSEVDCPAANDSPQ